MERYSDQAIEIINELHTERLDYESEYVPLIDCANRCKTYEDTGLEPERIMSAYNSCVEHMANFDAYRALGTVEHLRELVEAEKKGLLVRLPFKFGTNVYIPVKHVDPYSRYVSEITLGWHTYPAIVSELNRNNAFLTREEAEAALKGGDAQC